MFMLPLITPNLTGGGFNNVELFNLFQTTVLFLINPVIFFLVFYKLGPNIPVDGISDHLRILRNSFVGGSVGFAGGYLGLFAYEAIASSGAFSPTTDWFVWTAQTILALVREGINTAVFAFTGITIGRLRSEVPLAKETNFEAPAPVHGGDSSA